MLGAPALADQGASDDEVVIGSVGDLSGPFAAYGAPAVAAAQMHFDAVNAAGGIHGRTIRFVVEDTRARSGTSAELVADHARIAAHSEPGGGDRVRVRLDFGLGADVGDVTANARGIGRLIANLVREIERELIEFGIAEVDIFGLPLEEIAIQVPAPSRSLTVS